MRRANKQMFLQVPRSCIDTKSGRIPVQRSRYLQETYALKTGKRPLLPVSATIISKHVLSTCKFLNVLNNSQR